MKIHYNIIKRLLFATALPLIASCSKWFDVQPKTEIKEDMIFSNVSGYKAAQTGVYTLMAGQSLYGGELTMSFLDVLAQYYNFTGNTAYYFYAQHYDYGQAACKSVTESIWADAYKAIVNADNVLAHLDAGENVLSPMMHSVIRGEMLGIRAMLHFDILRMFAQAPVLGTDVPAIPYVDAVGRTPLPRLTVAQVLGRISDDCAEALNALAQYDPYSPDAVGISLTQDEKQFLTHREEHFNWQAVRALQCRVAMWQGQYDEASEIASELIRLQGDHISGNIFALYSDKLSNYSEDYFAPRQSTSLEISPETYISLFEVMKYGSNDNRSRNFVAAYPNTTNMFVSRWYKTNVLPTVDMPIFTTAEMYHTLAECLHHQGDDEGAIATLNTLRSAYGLEAFPMNYQTCDAMEEIQKDFRKHQIGLGQMFYFYKRLGIDPVPGAPDDFTISKYILPLPDDEVQFGNP